MTLANDRRPGDRAPIVYMVQEPRMRDRVTGVLRGLDTTPALEYGTVEVLLEPGAQVMLTATPTVRLLQRKLAGFRPGDFLLTAGDPVAIGIACAIVAGLTGGRFTLLKWDNHDHRYFPVPVDLTGGVT